MSFQNNKPTSHEVLQPDAPMARARRSAGVPAYRPQVLRSLRMHPVVAAAVGGVVLAGILGYALMQKPVYLAESVLAVEPAVPKLLNDGTVAGFDSARYDAFMQEQVAKVTRPDVLASAIGAAPESAWKEFGPTQQAATQALLAALKTQRVGTSYQMSIDLKGTDPKGAAAMVNAVTAAYLGAVRQDDAAQSDQRSQMLGEERSRINVELERDRAEQTALGAMLGIANPVGEAGNPYDAQLTGLRTELESAREAHEVAAAELASLSNAGPGRASGLQSAADELIANDAGLSSMKATISQRKATLAGQMAGMLPSNPVYKQDQDEIADLDRTLAGLTADLRDKAQRRVQEKLRTDLQRTGDVQARLTAQLNHDIAQATTAGPKLQRASEVAADIARLEIRRANVDDALHALELQATGPAQVHLALAAAVPDQPEASRTKLLLLAALPLALLFGIGAAVFLRKQDRRIYGPMDVEDVLGFAPIAVLPARADVAEPIYEEYVLRLAAGIESAYRADGARIFMLTAVSLSTDIEPLGAALTRKFGEIGVKVAVATATELLTPAEGDDGELMRTPDVGSEGFVGSNLARLRAEDGLVLVESQALVNSAQTEYVARCADATILVIESGVTTREDLMQAAGLLERLHVTGIGAVLEQMELRYADVSFRKAIEALEERQSFGRASRVAARGVVEDAEVVASPPQAMELPEMGHPEVVVGTSNTVEMSKVGDSEVVASPPQAMELPEMGHPEVVVDRPVVEIPEETDAVESVGKRTLQSEFAAIKPIGTAIDAADNADKGAGTAVERETVPEVTPIGAEMGGYREKIARRRSSSITGQTPHGDRGMKTSSWFSRLMGRDIEPVYRITPDRDENAGAEDLGISDKKLSTLKDDFDLPMTARLEEISRIRPGFPQAQRIDPEEPLHFEELDPVRAQFRSMGMMQSALAEAEIERAEAYAQARAARMSPVPPASEAVLAAQVAAEHSELVQEVLVHDVPVEIVAETAHGEAEVETPNLKLETPVAETPEIEDEAPAVEVAERRAPVFEAPYRFEAFAPVGLRGPRRPMSFHQLAGIAEGQPVPVAAASIAPAVVEPVIEPVTEPVAKVEQYFEEAAPVVAAEVVSPSQAIGLPEMGHPEAGLVYPESLPAFADPVFQQSSFHESAFQEPVYKEPIFKEPIYKEPRYIDDRYEEPKYEAEAAPATGRWDPIPPLRPSGESWRDRRPMLPPMRGSSDPEHRRWLSSVEEELGAVTPPAAWEAPLTAEDSEPLLTRQWGLLSKFQQARKQQAQPEPERDAETVSGSHGSRKG